MVSLLPPAPLPEFKVRLTVPDISPWLRGNTGVAGFTTRDSGRPGPHVALLSLMHGNEIAGAIVIDAMLRSGMMPAVGKLSLGFGNIAAFQRFDPQRPTATRFLDEDMNRVWDEAILNGPRHSVEIDRAREIRAFIDTVDIVLDLHSMLWPSEPLILSGGPAKGRDLAVAIGSPSLVVADHGHVNGRRLIDYVRFSNPDTPYAACLVEAGQHWQPATVASMRASVAGLLAHLGMSPPLPAAARREPVRVATVTTAVTAVTPNFAFVQAYRGGDIVPRRNTLIAMDGETEIRTPHDNCLLVMPSLRPSRGHTAVRLARFEPTGVAR
ncbi:MAG TPA: succinylglutamate desuccinylase/aspartoacylase family protein [Rhodopila sp.]|nr:succinylglutamate desuccinylase/aspartoacylase family protein [Rhodopila sp.]